MTQKNSKSDRRKLASFTRRNALKAIGAATLVGIGGTAPVSAAPKEKTRVIRLEGSYNSPISFAEGQATLEKLKAKNPNLDRKSSSEKAVPEFDDGYEIVEYVARVGANGRVSQYYGASSKEEESAAHQKGQEKVNEFESLEVSTQSTPSPDVGPDWNYIQDDQASTTDHWGELNHNYEWYRVRDGSEERNAFRTLIASSDGTINPYERKIYATHDWGESQLGNEALHNAGPSSTGAGSVTVGIGYPPSAQLSYTFDVDGQVNQNLTNNGPVIDWNYNIPNSGTSWFYPGSHVVADRSDCGVDQKVVTLEASTDWGLVYDSSHKWHITTVTC
ncbi:hypothetical protein E2L06_18350 [Haloterrigena sp. H1]|uniref:hypothetical protein n=1 Tax=Haloterrigena sp. H1 TaxID=2552943 RepID=UPI00110D5493|nr:hypothetical protein [Haloterrigena sp. H1]TMT80223.1 hypothetical protein E2L06_18350 [Haloterrigena sp. H1]